MNYWSDPYRCFAHETGDSVNNFWIVNDPDLLKGVKIGDETWL